jgi:hypothetical protein
MAMGGSACGIAEADGKRASLLRLDYRVITRAVP